MKPIQLIAILFAGLATLVTHGAAAKEKTPNVNAHPFWTGKKGGASTQLAPGLNAVLQLTETQKHKIAEAREELLNDSEVKSARGLSKSDPAVTPEQREKARAALEAATARLRERVAGILTPEQKSLVDKINAAYAAAVEETGIVYAEKFASPSIKTDPAMRRRIQDEKNQDTEEQFLHKLDSILTPAQREAMARAAEEELQRASKAPDSKKPAK